MGKKIVLLIILALLALGGYFLGKNIYYNKIYNYNKIVEEGMEEYYKSNDTTDIDSIRDLLILYENNEEIRSDIENKTFSIFNEWYDYTNSKYNCTLESVNECILYNQELDDLSNRLGKLAVYSLFPSDKSNLLMDEINANKKKIKEIIDDPKATREQTYEEHRKLLCDKISDDNCELQRDGTSYCTYILGTIKETVVCKKVFD